MLLYDHFEFLRKSDDAALPGSFRFMEELAKALDTRSLIRAACNALAYSENLVDDYLAVYLRVLVLQIRLIGPQAYSTFPLLAALNSAAARQTTHVNASHVAGDRTRRQLDTYGAIYVCVQ